MFEKEADHSCNCEGCKYIDLESIDEPCCDCSDSNKYEKETMFEKEAEEWSFRKKYTYGYSYTFRQVLDAYIDGAEYGYNKANEWHYVKDGLPSEDGRYLVCNIFSNNYVATNIAEFNSKNGIFGCIENSTIYAWKEIVLPELPKESE